MKIILCEDDKAQQQWMQEVLQEWHDKIGKSMKLLVYASAEELLFKQEEWSDAELMILDIELKEMNGMELAYKIRELDKKVPLLFATGYEKFVFEGYEVGAVSYMMKPIQKEKLFRTLDKVSLLQEKAGCVLIAGQEEDTVRIYAKDISYIESEGHYCRIVLRDKEIKIRGKISELQKQLPAEDFCLCHRSYLINVSCIKRITKKEVIMDDAASIPIARGKWEEVNSYFMAYYRKLM